MKALVKFIITGAFLFPILSVVISCSEEADCSMATRAMMQCYFYTLDPETEVVSNDTLDSLTVTAFGTDSIIINNQKKVHDLSLPLRYTADSTVLVFRYSKTLTDTLVVYQTNTPYFLSMDCGYQMKQSIKDVNYSRHSLDSIRIVNKEAGIYGTENLNYSISLALCLLLSLPLQAQNSNISAPPATTPPKTEKKDAKEEVHYPLYNGISISADLWGPGGKLLGSDFFSSEVAVDVSLKNRFFPTVEFGYGNTDTWSDKGIHYKTGAPYFRIGMDYNALYNKKHGHMILVGLRYAATSFKYDVESLAVSDPEYGGSLGNPNLIDGIWGGSLPFDHKGMKGSMQWAEFCVGIRAHVWKSLYMGWALRFKFRLSSSVAEYGDPWYVPGYGKYNGNTTGVTYTIIYKLPF